ncbi:MAG: hemolysin III family protein [Treponema sp.]|nr:hemolysin III family protein [Treponema sp.]
MEKDIQQDVAQNVLRYEIKNALIHGIGIIFCIATIPILSAIGARTGNVVGIVGATIYSFSFLMIFIFSTLYHSTQNSYAKEILRTWDHIAIYFMIAGTYTPFLLIYMLNPFGITLLSIQWSLVVLGIIFIIYFKNRAILSVIVYVAMGWLLLVGGRTFFVELPPSVLIMLIIGGGLYTLGCIFYLNKKIPYNHAIWHLFVLFAAVCHYVAVLLSVILSGRYVVV